MIFLDLSHTRPIVCRKITAEDDELRQAVTALRESGFINYFGMQRFGTSAEIMTPDIGCAVLKNEWKEVADLLLKPRDGGLFPRFIFPFPSPLPQLTSMLMSVDRGDMAKARKLWVDTQDVDQTLALVPKKFYLERCFLTGLKEFGMNNVLQAFCKIPRNMRMMYLHSVQSLIWNKAVSKRLREHGLRPVVGDLVFDQEKARAAAEAAKYTPSPLLSKNKGKSPKAKPQAPEAAEDFGGEKVCVRALLCEIELVESGW